MILLDYTSNGSSKVKDFPGAPSIVVFDGWVSFVILRETFYTQLYRDFRSFDSRLIRNAALTQDDIFSILGVMGIESAGTPSIAVFDGWVTIFLWGG